MNADEIARLTACLRRWTSTHPGWQRWPAHDIANELEQDADFQAIRLAAFLRTPQGQLIEQVAGMVLPYPYNLGADVLAEAITIAAQERTRKQRLATLAGGGALVLLLVLFLRNN